MQRTNSLESPRPHTVCIVQRFLPICPHVHIHTHVYMHICVFSFYTCAPSQWPVPGIPTDFPEGTLRVPRGLTEAWPLQTVLRAAGQQSNDRHVRRTSSPAQVTSQEPGGFTSLSLTVSRVLSCSGRPPPIHRHTGPSQHALTPALVLPSASQR